MLGLKGPRMSECSPDCQLSLRRDDACKPGVCYARLTHPDRWDDADYTWAPRPETDT